MGKCKYCHDDESEILMTGKNMIGEEPIMFGRSNHKWIEFCFDIRVAPDDRELFLEVDAGEDIPVVKGNAKINYCPMCGRKLEEEM